MVPRSMYLRSLLLVVALAGCGGDDDACAVVDTACQPLYEPTFSNLFDRTLLPKCGLSGGACHGDQGRQAGLAFVTADEAYDLLLGSDGRSRVTPSDAACSLITRRVASDDASFQMPPGGGMSEAEQCVIVQWIANGAER